MNHLESVINKQAECCEETHPAAPWGLWKTYFKCPFVKRLLVITQFKFIIIISHAGPYLSSSLAGQLSWRFLAVLWIGKSGAVYACASQVLQGSLVMHIPTCCIEDSCDKIYRLWAEIQQPHMRQTEGWGEKTTTIFYLIIWIPAGFAYLYELKCHEEVCF